MYNYYDYDDDYDYEYDYNPNDELYHYGVKGMKWGIRRFQNRDGSPTGAGRGRYGRKKFNWKKAAAIGAGALAVGGGLALAYKNRGAINNAYQKFHFQNQLRAGRMKRRLGVMGQQARFNAMTAGAKLQTGLGNVGQRIKGAHIGTRIGAGAKSAAKAVGAGARGAVRSIGSGVKAAGGKIKGAYRTAKAGGFSRSRMRANATAMSNYRNAYNMNKYRANKKMARTLLRASGRYAGAPWMR